MEIIPKPDYVIRHVKISDNPIVEFPSIAGIDNLGPEVFELLPVFDISRAEKLPPLTEWSHRIQLCPDAKLKQCRPYKHSFEEDAILQEEICRGETSGRIVRSKAMHASPVLFVKVPGKSPRMCIDYRHLNSQMITEPAILPNIQDL
jgi:hypothetical protein